MSRGALSNGQVSDGVREAEKVGPAVRTRQRTSATVRGSSGTTVDFLTGDGHRNPIVVTLPSDWSSSQGKGLGPRGRLSEKHGDEEQDT